MQQRNHEAEDGITNTNTEDEIPTLGQFLAQCRKMTGMNREEAAKIIGISSVYLYRLESDQTKRPSLMTVARIAQTYGLNVELLGQLQAYHEEIQVIKKIQALEGKSPLKLVGIDLTELPPGAQQLYLRLLTHLVPS